MRPDGSICLRIRAEKPARCELLRGIHNGPPPACRSPQQRPRQFNSKAQSTGVDLLRGMPEPAGCNAARKIPQKRLGKAFPEEPFAGLSHGVNRRTNNGSASQFQVDNQNELTNYSGTTCAYDSNGNLTSAGVNKLYVYDDENRLVQWFSYQTSCTSPQNGDLRTDFI